MVAKSVFIEIVAQFLTSHDDFIFAAFVGLPY